jgi:hypothetical protein
LEHLLHASHDILNLHPSGLKAAHRTLQLGSLRWQSYTLSVISFLLHIRSHPGSCSSNLCSGLNALHGSSTRNSDYRLAIAGNSWQSSTSLFLAGAANVRRHSHGHSICSSLGETC